jgi:hypothetical protein
MNKEERKEQIVPEKSENKKTTEMRKFLLIITQNVNVPNTPIKRHALADWIKNKTHLFVF